MDRGDSCDEKDLGRKNRRDTLVVIGVVVVLVALGFVLVRILNPGYSRRPFQREEYVLDDYVTISAYGKDQSQVEAAVEAAFRELYRIQEVADRHDPGSELARLNAAAAAGPVAVSDDLWEMISVGMEVYGESGGLFDITVGPLIDLWDVKGRGERGDPPPTQAEIDEAREKVGAEKLAMDETAHTVFFSQAGMAIDLGGLAKGYALDRAAEALRSRGVDTGVINMISTSLTLGDKPGDAGGPAWRIAITNPHGEGYLGTLSVPGGTYISTSGDYQRYFDYHGERYHHILDPRTGYPARAAMAVTVIGGASGVWSDALSTAAFVMGYPDALTWMDGRGDCGAVMVDTEGQVHASSGLGPALEGLEERV